MTIEQQAFENNFAKCAHCRFRRPRSAMAELFGQLRCSDVERCHQFLINSIRDAAFEQGARLVERELGEDLVGGRFEIRIISAPVLARKLRELKSDAVPVLGFLARLKP